MKKEFVNELDPRLLGLTAYNSFTMHDAASRNYMGSNHYAQRLVIENPDSRRVIGGMEKELAKYTFAARMPEDGVIMSIVERYPRGMGRDSLNFNPETVVIYERESDKKIDCFTINHHISHDQHFGYALKPTENMSKLIPNAPIAKDTVFADSPSVDENGDYKYGLNLNTALMSIPAVAEDGFVIARSVVERSEFRLYENRSVELGSKDFPLNIFGGKDNYKIFPEIGETIEGGKGSNGGLLMALRKYDDDLAPAFMSELDCMDVDFMFDKTVYVRGTQGRVVDIKVIRSNSPVRNLPNEMTEQLERYHKANVNFYQRLLDVDQKLRFERKRKYGEETLNMSSKLHNLLTEALVMVNKEHPFHKQPLNLLHKKIPIDEYRVEFVIEYMLKPTRGSKMTTSHGSK